MYYLLLHMSGIFVYASNILVDQIFALARNLHFIISDFNGHELKSAHPLIVIIKTVFSPS